MTAFHRNQYVKVDQAVINRGNQSVCHAMGDQAEMLQTAGRINDDEVVFTCSRNFFELRYELFRISAVAGHATIGVAALRSPNFLKFRYEPTQVSAVVRPLFSDRIVIGRI